MARNRNSKNGVLRAKRMKRSARLQSAVPWLKRFAGKNVLRGYGKHFGVDWRCAAIELKQLGIRLEPEELNRREQSEQQLADARRRLQETRESKHSRRDPTEYESIFDAYLAKDFAATHAQECHRDGIAPDSAEGPIDASSTSCAPEKRL